MDRQQMQSQQKGQGVIFSDLIFNMSVVFMINYFFKGMFHHSKTFFMTDFINLKINQLSFLKVLIKI
jgi:hypothetical protein